MTMMTVMTVRAGARDLRHCAQKMTVLSCTRMYRHKRHLRHERGRTMMNCCRSEKREATRHFSVRQGNKQRICPDRFSCQGNPETLWRNITNKIALAEMYKLRKE
jgi:hypothetical protein